MRFVGRVHAEDGSPLRRAEVTIVGPGGEPAGRGTVQSGNLDAEGDPPAVWGILIDGRPVISFPAEVEGERVDIGEFTMVEGGVPAAAFHAIEGRVFGLPAFAREAAPETVPPLEEPALRSATLGVSGGLTFSGLVGSTARQLGDAVRAPTGLNLTGAAVVLKGVPMILEDAVGLDFPNADLAATGEGLSQLSFSLRPQVDQTPPQAPSRPEMPDLIGYTRELALRKLAALGFAADVTGEVVTDAAESGRVVRTLPQPGTPLEQETLPRLFIGKHEGR